MKLADLVDLEWLLATRPGLRAPDSPAVDDALSGRTALASAHGCSPAELRRRLERDLGLRHEVALAWMETQREAALRSAGMTASPGQRVAVGLSWAGWVLALVGVLMGAGAARALLAYDGTTPVNVLHFVGLFFVLQMLLFAGMLLAVVFGRRRSGPSPLSALLRSLVTRLSGLGRFGRRASEAVGAATPVVDVWEQRRVVHADVERWTLFTLAQRFGVAFNLGALAACLALVIFSDLVFAWSTTLDVQAAFVHRVLAAAAGPWAGLLTDAVPTAEMVGASRWERMGSAFTGGLTLNEAVPLAAGWWRFLVAGLVTYGLLPRVLAWWLGGALAARARRRARLDDGAYVGLFDRLFPAATGWDGPRAEDVSRPPVPAGAVRSRAQALADGESGGPLSVLCWGRLASCKEQVREAVTRRFGEPPDVMVTAGGHELDGDVAALDQLAGSRGRLVLAVEVGQQPTKEMLRLLEAMRACTDGHRPIVVALLRETGSGVLTAGDAEDAASWRGVLAAHGDPWTWVDGPVQENPA